MRHKRIILALGAVAMAMAILFAAGSAARNARGQEIHVAAAASMAAVLQRLATDFEDSHGITVHLYLASSGLLRKKVDAGARFDAFISDSAMDMDLLAKSGYLAGDTRRNLLRNRLVCVVRASSDLSIAGPDDLRSENLRRIAIGDPGHVPAGIYASQALTYAGLWSTLADKFIPCTDARAAVAQLKAGAVDASIVYTSDVAANSAFKAAFEFPPNRHSPIVYPVSVMKNARNPLDAKTFLDYLRSAHAKELFREYGFEPIPSEVK